jgi:hypothetical protein
MAGLICDGSWDRLSSPVASILIQEYKAMNFYLAETIAFAIGLQITTNFGGC